MSAQSMSALPHCDSEAAVRCEPHRAAAAVPIRPSEAAQVGDSALPVCRGRLFARGPGRPTTVQRLLACLSDQMDPCDLLCLDLGPAEAVRSSLDRERAVSWRAG